MNTTIRKIYFTVLLTILSGSSLIAQTTTIQDSLHPMNYTFTQFGRESMDFLKQPGKWNGSDWLKIGLISAGTVLMIETADRPIRTFALDHPANYKSVPIEFGRIWGEIYSPFIFFGGYAAHSLITGDIGTRKIAYEIGQASIYAGVINLLLKIAIGRGRPYLNDGPTTFRPFFSIMNQDFHSNPSGHSTVAFVISTVLSRNAKAGWLKVLAYVPAVLTIVSRVYQDQHWASDDLLGAAFGYYIANWVVDQHENNHVSLGVSPTFPLSIRIAL